MTPVLGCIADDFTGAGDIANMLAKAGCNTLVVFDTQGQTDTSGYSAVVIALKSRSIPTQSAVEQSLAALEWLQAAGAKRFYFKYCSTFDSTPEGNIGPVADALMAALETDFTIACPAYPGNGRTVYRGHLFVGDALLSESPLRDHPLNPMKDANIVRVLSQQTVHKVGLIRHAVIERGAAAIAEAMADARTSGQAICVVDTIADAQLPVLAHAFRDLPLLTGGSALAAGLPVAYGDLGEIQPPSSAVLEAVQPSPTAILCGSCSARTLEQIAAAPAWMPRFRVRLESEDDVEIALAEFDSWLAAQPDGTTPLVFSSAPPNEVVQQKERIGEVEAGPILENLLARMGLALRSQGYRRFVVAGGETSGAIIKAFDIAAVEIGPEIDEGVPVCVTNDADPIALVMKSGNFGGVDFFARAHEALA